MQRGGKGQTPSGGADVTLRNKRGPLARPLAAAALLFGGLAMTIASAQTTPIEPEGPIDPVTGLIIPGQGPEVQEGCLSLAEGVENALDFDPRIERAEANREAARAGITAAQSRNLPQVSAFGQTGFGDTAPLDRRRDDQAGFQLNQELYSFGQRRAAQQQASSRYRAARVGVEESAQDVALGVVNAYLQAAEAVSRVSLAEEEAAVYGRDAESAATRLERRVITLTDASQIRARFARARSQVIDAKVAAATAMERLKLLTDNPYLECLAPSSVPRYMEREAVRLLQLAPEMAVDEAIGRSPSLRRLRAQTNAAEAQLKEARRAHMPTVSLTAFQLWASENVPQQIFEDTDGDGIGDTPRTVANSDVVQDSRVGLNLQQELFTGGRIRAGRNDAAARVQGAQADARLERLSLEDQVRRALAEARALREANVALSEARDQARIQLDSTLKEYERRTKTLTDLVLATEDYYTAANQELSTRFRFYAALARLQASMGTIADPALR